MSKRRSINSRAKKAEVNVQQFLWPGSEFAGNAKRPALEDQDLCGQDWKEQWWWGEVKNDSNETIKAKGGVWCDLYDAFCQAEDAIRRNENVWGGYTPTKPIPFAVLWPKNSRKPEQRLVMLEVFGLLVIITLDSFKDKFINNRFTNELSVDLQQ